jgi:hypothetical protein
MDRRHAEWDLLERVICLPEGMWTPETAARQKERYEAAKAEAETRIRHLVKVMGQKGRTTITRQYTHYRERVKMLRARVREHKRKRMGPVSKKPTRARVNADAVALQDSVEIVQNVQWGEIEDNVAVVPEQRYSLRQRNAQRVVAYKGSGGIAARKNEFSSRATRASTRGVVFAAPSPATPVSFTGVLGRTRSGLV